MKGSDALVHIQHGYDFAGNRTFRYDSVHAANSELYAYDQVGQIRNLQRGSLNEERTSIVSKNFEETWGFDKTGNWNSYNKNGAIENRAHNAANEIQGICTHDKNGNMVLMPGLKGKYDAWNRLVEVRDASDNLLVRYEYNGLNQRIKKTAGNSVTRSVFNEKWQEVESQTGAELTSYVWGLRYVDDLVCRQRGEEKLYSLADPNWNVVALADVSGVVKERYRYDAFGKITATMDSGIDFDRAFTGQVLDKETGLMLYRNRFYNTDLGRFVSRDPVEYKSGDENIYRYVKNAASRFVDSTGLACGECTPPSAYQIFAGPFGATGNPELVDVAKSIQDAADAISALDALSSPITVVTTTIPTVTDTSKPIPGTGLAGIVSNGIAAGRPYRLYVKVTTCRCSPCSLSCIRGSAYSCSTTYYKCSQNSPPHEGFVNGSTDTPSGNEPTLADYKACRADAVKANPL